MPSSQTRTVRPSGPTPPVIASTYRLPSTIEASPMMIFTTGKDRLPVRIIDYEKDDEAPEVQPDQDVFMILDTYAWVEGEDGERHNKDVRAWLSTSGCDLKWTSGKKSAFNATVKALKKTKPQLSGHVNNNANNRLATAGIRNIRVTAGLSGTWLFHSLSRDKVKIFVPQHILEAREQRKLDGVRRQAVKDYQMSRYAEVGRAYIDGEPTGRAVQRARGCDEAIEDALGELELRDTSPRWQPRRSGARYESRSPEDRGRARNSRDSGYDSSYGSKSREPRGREPRSHQSSRGNSDTRYEHSPVCDRPAQALRCPQDEYSRQNRYSRQGQSSSQGRPPKQGEQPNPEDFSQEEIFRAARFLRHATNNRFAISNQHRETLPRSSPNPSNSSTTVRRDNANRWVQSVAREMGQELRASLEASL